MKLLLNGAKRYTICMAIYDIEICHMYTTNDLGNIILQWKHLIVTAKQQHIISDLKKKWKFNPDCINSEIPEIHTDDITGRMEQ